MIAFFLDDTDIKIHAYAFAKMGEILVFSF